MSKIKLSNYLNKIEAKYVKAREDWEKLQKELKEEDKRYQEINWSLYSLEGRSEEQKKHNSKVKELKKSLENIRKDFLQSVDDIKKDSNRVFDKLFQYTPEDVDMKGVSILQNSSMNEKELMNLAERYRKEGNSTMYFLVSEKLKNSDSREAQTYYNESLRTRNLRTDHDLIDGYGSICLKALRDEESLSNGIHRLHDEFYQKYKEATEEISVDTSSPWEE